MVVYAAPELGHAAPVFRARYARCRHAGEQYLVSRRGDVNRLPHCGHVSFRAACRRARLCSRSAALAHAGVQYQSPRAFHIWRRHHARFLGGVLQSFGGRQSMQNGRRLPDQRSPLWRYSGPVVVVPHPSHVTGTSRDSVVTYRGDVTPVRPARGHSSSSAATMLARASSMAARAASSSSTMASARSKSKP